MFQKNTNYYFRIINYRNQVKNVKQIMQNFTDNFLIIKPVQPIISL
jgi:hypothetical protein